jgi:hypothetical protein
LPRRFAGQIQRAAYPDLSILPPARPQLKLGRSTRTINLVGKPSQAVPGIIDGLKSRGYGFVTVSGLLRSEGDRDPQEKNDGL